jgi:CheY-like chemotaxis protein
MAETLASACRSWGWEATRLRAPGDAAAGAIAAVFDCGRCLDDELVELQRTAAALAPAPLIAIVHFPRIEDCERARQAGAAAALAKPLQWADLFAELDRVNATARGGPIKP